MGVFGKRKEGQLGANEMGGNLIEKSYFYYIYYVLSEEARAGGDSDVDL